MMNINLELKLIISGLLAVVAVGCSLFTGVENPRIEFRTDQEVYSIGQRGELLLTNYTGSDIEIGIVPQLGPEGDESLVANLQVWMEGEWETQLTSRILVLGQRRIDHGDSFSNLFNVIASEFSPGNNYRYVTMIHDLNTENDRPIYSEPFMVIE